MRIALSQTKPVTGDLEGNVMQIIRDLRSAREQNAQLFVTAETAITAYNCGALLENHEFIAYNKALLEEVIAPQVPEDMAALVGFIDFKGYKPNGKMELTNSVALIQGGKIVDTYDKQLLANDDHHEDAHYFTPGTRSKVLEATLGGQTVKIGTPICEDSWNRDHARDIVAEMVDQGAQIIVSANYSYTYFGKQERRHDLFGNHAAEKHVPVVMVNAAGIGDIVKNIMIYDGGSFVRDANNNLVAELARFRQDLQVVDVPLHGSAETQSSPKQWEKYEETYEAIVFGLREHFAISGIKKAQVHISGGIDSAVVAALATDALGPENCVFISNPTEDNGDITKGFAQYVADQNGVKLVWNPTQAPYESIVDTYERSFGEKASDNARTCAQAVLRTTQGLMASHMKGSSIIATGNHTENILGWANFHDIGSIGIDAPLLDLTKVEVFGLATYINARAGKELIPASLYDGTVPPMAEVRNAKEDGIDYFVMSGVCADMIRDRRTVNEIIAAYDARTLDAQRYPSDHSGRSIYEHCGRDEFVTQVKDAFRRSKISVYKSAQGAPGFVLSPRTRGFSNREVLLNKYKGEYNIAAIKQQAAEFRQQVGERYA